MVDLHDHIHVDFPQYSEMKFVPSTKEYGNAEFLFCPYVRRSKMLFVDVCPLQQPDKFNHYSRLVGPFKGIMFGSFLGGGVLSHPKIWHSMYCEVHKSFQYRMYVPYGSTSLMWSHSCGCLSIMWD